jgi:hypothetical protein
LVEEEKVDNTKQEVETPEKVDNTKAAVETPEPETVPMEELKALQRELSKRNLRIKELESRPQDNTSVVAELKAMRSDQSRQREALMVLGKHLDKINSGELDTTSGSELSAELARIFDSRDKEEFEALLSVVGLSKDDPRLSYVHSAPSSREAVERLKALMPFIQQQKPTEEPKPQVETAEEMEARIRREVEAEIRQKANLKEVSTATPSGGISDDDFIIAYGKGEVHDDKRAMEIFKKQIGV